MTDAGRQDASADRQKLERLTVLAFGAVILLGGLNGIAAKQILRELEPFWSGVIRFAIAGLIMLAIAVATRRSLPRGRSLLGAMAYGTLGFAFTFGLFFTGLRDTPISTAAVFLALTPLMTFGLAIAHGQEQFRLQGLVGALVAVVGVALIFADQLAADIPLGSLVLLLLGALCLAETGVIVKLIPRSDPVGTNAVGMLTGCAVPTAPFAFHRGATWVADRADHLGCARLSRHPRFGGPLRTVRLHARTLDSVGCLVQRSADSTRHHCDRHVAHRRAVHALVPAGRRGGSGRRLHRLLPAPAATTDGHDQRARVPTARGTRGGGRPVARVRETVWSRH